MKTLRLISAIFLISGFFVCCSSAKRKTELEKKYKLEKIVYDVQDNNLRQLLESQKKQTVFKKGRPLKKSTFIKERKRIVALIRKNQNPNYSENKVRFEIDTTLAKNRFSVVAIVKN
jgi:hypothetical protein